MPAPIAILTDFGISDPFVGIIKGVIAQTAPQALMVDLTHAVPPGDILRAAVYLWQAVPYFPSGTVFLCVVDPGVGTPRKALFITVSRQGKDFTFIGPDNGLFSFVLEENFQSWEIDPGRLGVEKRSHTFHGRDIFAPAAAKAWLGANAAAFGLPAPDPVRLPQPRLAYSSTDALEGEVLFSDHFGNILTSLGSFEWEEGSVLPFKPWLKGAASRRFKLEELQVLLPSGERAHLARTFGDLQPQKWGAVVGSSGLIEIAVNQGSAADQLKLERGALVRLITEKNPI